MGIIVWAGKSSVETRAVCRMGLVSIHFLPKLTPLTDLWTHGRVPTAFTRPNATF